MKASLRIFQKDALLAGQNTHGNIIVNFDPSEMTKAELEELARCRIYEEAFLVTEGFPHEVVTPITIANLESLKQALADKIAIREEALAERIERAREYMANPDEHLIDYREFGDPGFRYNLSKYGVERLRKVENDFPEAKAYLEKLGIEVSVKNLHDLRESANQFLSADIDSHIKRSTFRGYPDREFIEARFPRNSRKAIKDTDLKAKVDARMEEIEARCKELDRIETDKIKREEAEAAEARAVQIRAWVETYGTQSQKDRLEAAVFPEQEAIDGIRALTFQLLDGFPRYQKIKSTEVCECDAYYSDNPCDVDFETEEKLELTEAEFDRFNMIQESMPDATVYPRLHIGEGDTCDGRIERTGFMVRITVGVFEFSREYGLGDDDVLDIDTLEEDFESSRED